MPASSTNSAPEFRPYRRFVAWFVLAFVSLGSLYLLASVVLTIYRQRHAVPTGATISSGVTDAELRSCWQELTDVLEGLQKHLEKSHYVLGTYDQEEAQRWANEGAFWRNQWLVLGKRCRFGAGAVVRARKEFEQLVGTWQELSETERIYTRELLRFGREQAPRLGRIRTRVRVIGERLDRSQAPTKETQP